jgi:hypothetical protein
MEGLDIPAGRPLDDMAYWRLVWLVCLAMGFGVLAGRVMFFH